MMPLLLPADLNAQGMGYLLTMVCFYTLPYLVNLGLVVVIITFLITKQSQLSSRSIIGGGAAATIVYLAIFSMESASVLLASFAGCVLLSRVFTAYREHKSLVAALKTRTFFDLCLVAIIILWAIALWQMIHSGRAGYCASFELTRGIAYLDTTLKGIRVGFVQLFVAVYILSLFGAFWIKNPRHRLTLLSLHLWIVCLVVFYTLTTSKCGATWYLMSGLLMAMLVFMAISLSIFVAQYTLSYIIISAFFFIV